MSEDIVPRGLRLDVRCKDCMFHTRMAHAAIGKACTTLGIEEYAKPCKRFQPSPFRMEEALSNDRRAEVTHLLTHVKDSNISALAALINNEKRTRSHGYCYGQTVYIQHTQRSYLSNWSSATVISADKEYVYVRGSEDYVASLKRSSVRTVRAFSKLRARYLREGKLRDPESYKKGGSSTATATEMKKSTYKPKLATKVKKPKKSKIKVSSGGITVRGSKTKKSK